MDWKTFSSTSRPWHDPNSVRARKSCSPTIRRVTPTVRSVIATALSPKALNKMAEAFRADAQALVTRVKQKSGETIDAVGEITQPFVYKVLPDLLGVPVKGREHMYAFGHMVWATMGPMNELFQEAHERHGERSAASGRTCAVSGKTSRRAASAWRCISPPIAATSRRRKRS